jgi:hypothetical protein
MSLQEFLPTPKFDDYKEFFKDFFTLERRDDGVLLARAHTAGGSVQLSVQNHRALGQFLAINAQTALEYGMVNEILPREELIPRAYTIADHIMSQPRTVRRLTTQIIRRPWKKRILDDLDGGFGIQMFGHLAKGKSVHSDDYISGSANYVREGRMTPFD